MKILLIEDDEDTRAVFKESLEIDNHEVIEAADGMLGLDVIRSGAPDLIISDFRMPRMNGDELFDKLRDAKANSEIPFIFLSGNTTEDDVIRRLNDGADLCLSKPIKPSLLRAHVKSCMSKYERFADYMASKLDEIAASMPQEVDRNFETGRSLTANLHNYADVVVDAVKHTMEHPDSSGEESSTGSPFLDSGKSKQDNRLAFVRMCLREFDRRRALVSDMGSETLTWQLIFLVAESQMVHEQVFVSDLYVTATSAKTTTNNRINSLVASGVFEKRQHETDARRQNIVLSEQFTELLDKYIDETIRYISEILRD